jgi:integrase
MVNHVLPVFGHMPLTRIDRAAVQRWVNSLTADGYAPATVKKIYETLSSVLRTAVSYERLTRSPCDKVTLPPVGHIEMRFLVPDEVNLLAKTITPYFELLIRFSAETGLRIGELAGLQGGDYQPAHHTIDVKRQLLKDTTPPTYGDPKTAAGIRSLTLSPSLAARIQAVGAVGDTPVFTSTGGGLLNVSNFRSRHFTPAVEAAGLGHVRIHDLRHSAISWWIHQGATIKQVTARAGIASVATAFDRYGHILPNEDQDLARRLDQPAVGQ